MAASIKNGIKTFNFEQEGAKKVARHQKDKIAAKVISHDQIVVDQDNSYLDNNQKLRAMIL